MGIPDGVTRVVYSGSLANGQEKWAFSLWWTRPGIEAFDFSTGEPTAASYVAWRDSFLVWMRSTDAFTGLDAYYYQGGIAVTHTQAVFAHAGTGTLGAHPPQIAGCITLRTALATRSGRGRIYIPATAVAVVTTAGGSTGHGSSSVINDTVDKLGLYMQAITAAAPDTHPVVVSQTQSATHVVTSVDADDVLDTQRRRRNKLTSTRHSHAAQ